MIHIVIFYRGVTEKNNALKSMHYTHTLRVKTVNIRILYYTKLGICICNLLNELSEHNYFNMIFNFF